MPEINALPVQLTADQLESRLRGLAFRIGNRVHDFRGDDFEPVRSILLAVVGELDNIAAEVLPSVRPAIPRDAGLDTREWAAGRRPMGRNRGHL